MNLSVEVRPKQVSRHVINFECRHGRKNKIPTNPGKLDILFLNESKLNETIPDSLISHKNYSCYRRDRDYLSTTDLNRNGGGIVVYIRKEFIHSVKKSDTFECMHINLICQNTSMNFLACYKSPSINNQDYLDFLENYVSSIDLKDPLFIVGDLNIDLLSKHENLLIRFIENFKLKNFITSPTRIQTRLFKATNTTSTSSSLIDVLIHNGELITCTKVIGCPYSDHHFIVGSIILNSAKPKPLVLWSRNLNDKNIELIEKRLSQADFSLIDKLNSSNDKWEYFKSSVLKHIDEIAPIKKIKLIPENKFPWFDIELFKAKKLRDVSILKERMQQIIQ